MTMEGRTSQEPPRAEMVRLSVGPLETNCYLLADGASGTAAVIDPGDETWSIQHSLQMHEWSLAWVLVTHAHFDHIAACGQLAEAAGCPIALHPADLPLWWMHGAADQMGIRIPDQPVPEHALAAGRLWTLADCGWRFCTCPATRPDTSVFFSGSKDGCSPAMCSSPTEAWAARISWAAMN